MALIAIDKCTKLDELEHWGQITDFDGEVLGDMTHVDVYGKKSFGEPSDAISAGYFATTKGTYRLVYPFNEQAVILIGELEITDESTGITTLFKAGDIWVVNAGVSTIWHVKSDFFIKHYFTAI